MSSRLNRSGVYVRQPAGYRAFIPAPLPPIPPIAVDGSMQRLLSKADLSLGRLAGSIDTLPNPDLFVAMYVRREAVLSSQIEGTQSSLNDVLAAEAHMTGNAEPDDVNEVLNYVRAMNQGLRRLATLPVSVRLIRELHQHLLQGTRGHHLVPGEVRTSQNWIGPAGCALNDAIFVPPPPHEVADHLGKLEQFLHADDGMALLIRIGLAHAQFETIHPFLDGNGRVGRLLITFLLCEQRILDKPVLYLSHFFKRHRSEYYDRLQAVRDEGRYEEWLAFFLTGVAEVSAEAAQTARKILLLREEHRNRIATLLGASAGRGHRLLEHLFEHPIVSVEAVKDFLETTYPTANTLVGRLQELGILHEMTGQNRNRRFRYDPYVQLFNDP